jgi:CRISPR/Cas system-associated protein Csm6
LDVKTQLVSNVVLEVLDADAVFGHLESENDLVCIPWTSPKLDQGLYRSYRRNVTEFVEDAA